MNSYREARAMLDRGDIDEFIAVAHGSTTRAEKMLMIAAVVVELTDCLWHINIIRTRGSAELDDEDALAEEREVWRKLTGLPDFTGILEALDAAAEHLLLFTPLSS